MLAEVNALELCHAQRENGELLLGELDESPPTGVMGFRGEYGSVNLPLGHLMQIRRKKKARSR